jgi:hypothetical protein
MKVASLQHAFVPFFFGSADFVGMSDFACLRFSLRNLSIQVLFLFDFLAESSFSSALQH